MHAWLEENPSQTTTHSLTSATPRVCMNARVKVVELYDDKKSSQRGERKVGECRQRALETWIFHLKLMPTRRKRLTFFLHVVVSGERKLHPENAIQSVML